MDVMRKKLVIEYDGTNALATTLIETAIKEIHESPSGKLHKILNEEDPVSLELNLIAGISAVSK